MQSECLSVFSNGCECWRFRCYFLSDTTRNLSSYLRYLAHCRSMSLSRCRMLSSPYPRHDVVSAFWDLTVHSIYLSSLLIKHSASRNTSPVILPITACHHVGCDAQQAAMSPQSLLSSITKQSFLPQATPPGRRLNEKKKVPINQHHLDEVRMIRTSFSASRSLIDHSRVGCRCCRWVSLVGIAGRFRRSIHVYVVLHLGDVLTHCGCAYPSGYLVGPVG